MKNLFSKMKNRICGRLSDRRGMTMAEVLIVIAIIGVLSGVAFIAVQNYQRSMAQLEREIIAKEIFVAAQNHLTMAKGEGYLGATTAGTEVSGASDEYYYTVNPTKTSDQFSLGSILEQMLPFGSVDETVRAGGSYIIHYQKSAGRVLDVFYCSVNADRFNHTLVQDDYEKVISNYKGDDKKDARKNADQLSGDPVPVIGWFGGDVASSLSNLTLEKPSIEVINAERLRVVITDPNKAKTGACLRLWIEGETSGKKAFITAYEKDSATSLGDVTPIKTTAGGDIYSIDLDNITDGNKHFSELLNEFYPGENITVWAEAYSKTALTNIEYSAKVTTNSLFGDLTVEGEGENAEATVEIRNIRHLENLDKGFSKASVDTLKIKKAVQTSDLDWTKVEKDEDGYWQKYKVAGEANVDMFRPVELNYALSYDGGSYSIAKVVINHTGDAGIFGSAQSNDSIKNLELIDTTVTGTTNAGALAGSLNGTTVENVVARNSAAFDKTKANAATITASSGSAGGLIGSITGGKVEYSAAALVVNGNTNAGGLIGTVSGSTTITGCYSGGHTKNGEYYTRTTDASGNETKTPIYNVTCSTTAGGLIGDAGGASITNSYSTCSVSGSTAGGFVGTASGLIANCYCTGLVSGETTTDSTGNKVVVNNAFIGSGGSDVSYTGTNYYYELVNEVQIKDDTGKVTGIEYKGSGATKVAGSNSVIALDKDAATYNAFVGADGTWDPASAYDASLVKYYSGKYNLRTVLQLPAGDTNSKTKKADETDSKDKFVATHYGDWPAPEVFIINT